MTKDLCNFYDKRLVYEHKGATVLSRWDGIVAVSVPSKVLQLLNYANIYAESLLFNRKRALLALLENDRYRM